MAGPTLRGDAPSWEHLLSPEELAPSCGLGLLCASNVEACAAEISRQSNKPKSTPVVWALILGTHSWVSSFYYTQATPNSSISISIIWGQMGDQIANVSIRFTYLSLYI